MESGFQRNRLINVLFLTRIDGSLPPMFKPLYTFADKARQGRVGELAAGIWHRLAPPIPIWKKIYGVNVCLDLRDSLIFWARSSKDIEKAEGFDIMLKNINGTVWDVGCNVGIFSLYASSLGRRVIAFDISKKACKLLEKSSKSNFLQVKTIPRAFSVKTFHYSAPDNADARNRPSDVGLNDETSITYLEAADQFGIPSFIKLDIEYAEVDFLKSPEFKCWIQTHRIPLLIELHEKHFWDLVWPDVPHVRFTESHVLFNSP